MPGDRQAPSAGHSRGTAYLGFPWAVIAKGPGQARNGTYG
jgi:hypothetical protein